jgi:hypothetical protein
VGFDYEVVPNATVQLGDQTSQTNQEGGDLHQYEIAHPDYPIPSRGKLLIPEGDDVVIPVQIFQQPPNEITEAASLVSEVSAIEWVDTRYEVTILVEEYGTGLAVAGASVLFAGETKLTDGEGKAVFHQVTPAPTIPRYEVWINDCLTALVTVAGHEATRKITIVIQVGAEIMPKSLTDEMGIKANIASILWVEV